MNRYWYIDTDTSDTGTYTLNWYWQQKLIHTHGTGNKYRQVDTGTYRELVLVTIQITTGTDTGEDRYKILESETALYGKSAKQPHNSRT